MRFLFLFSFTFVFFPHHAHRVKPGIAKVAPAQVREYLQPLLEYATGLVPQKSRAATPIFLFATAGMRVIPEAAQTAILAEVRRSLAATDFNFTYQEQWARVISGSDEGAYGWVTANYLRGILFRDDARRDVVGALDLGGASLQLTFLPAAPPQNESYRLVLPNNVFELYTHSYLGYGQDMITRTLIEHAAEHARAADGTIPERVPFPCYLRGYSEHVNLTADGAVHTVVGSGNHSLCSEYQLAAMRLDAPCPVAPCSFDGVYQPPLRGEFYAMSGFFYTADFLGFASNNRTATPSRFFDGAAAFCASSWDDALKSHPEIEPANLKVYCLTSSYIYNLLTRGFGFSPNEARIYFTHDINGSSLNWALGGLIAEASLLPK